MLKNLVGIEFKIEDRVIKLICDNDCPLAYLKEALFQYQKYVGQIEDQVKATQEKNSCEKTQKEDCDKCDAQSTTEEKVCQ